MTSTSRTFTALQLISKPLFLCALWVMSSLFLPTPLSSVSFEDKFRFSAGQSLLPYARHGRFPSSPRHNRVDVWDVKAPDFSIRLYRSVSPPRKKNERRVLPPPPAGDEGVKLPKVVPERERRTETPKFRTFYRPPGAEEAQVLFVTTGTFPKERYKNPTPHNFRPLDEEVPDFITTYDKDPGNIRLRLTALDTIPNPSPPSAVKPRQSKLDTFRPAEPQWDPGLLLPVGPWPPKSASYTRHKRRRGAYSAFLERVEEKLTRSWHKS